MRNPTRFILLGLAFAGAYVIGRVTVDTAPGEPRVVERNNERTIVQQQVRESIRLDEVRAVVREELATQRSAPSNGEPTQQIDEQRLGHARSILDQGMADGRWSQADRDQLRAIFLALSPAEGEKVLSTLFTALNSRRVVAEFRGAPI